MNVKTLIIPLFLVLFCCVFGCRNKQHSTTDESTRDLPQIKDSGELVVLTLYSSTSYFIYRGQEMGFQYELSEQFAKSLGLKLRIEVAKSVDEMIQKLRAGEGAIEHWTKMELGNDKQPQLYDLSSDPSEKTNVSKQHPDIVKELSELLESVKEK